MTALPLMHESWGVWPWFAPLWILLALAALASLAGLRLVRRS